MWFFRDCPFKGIGSLPKFWDLTPRCQINSPLPNWLTAASCGGKIWLPAASCNGKIWCSSQNLLPAASCSGKIWLPITRCSMESHLPIAKCSGKIWLPAASCSAEISAAIIDLTTRCIMQQRDLTPVAWRSGEISASHLLYSPLHHASERFDSPLHNAAERFDAPLHDAAGSQISIIIAPPIWNQIWEKLRYKSGSKVGTFDEKMEVENLALLSL